ncbi:MAG: transporter [Caulobacter sp.]|nr:transporter [Caulobacter sp.]
MLTTLYVEARKLKGSLVAWLCLAAPTLVAVLLSVIFFRVRVASWTDNLTGATGLWAYFVMPMTITALTILVAQVEHGPRAWDHLLALPVPRWRLFAAKGIVVMGLIALMSVLLALEIRAAGFMVEHVAPKRAPTGVFSWLLLIKLLSAMWGAALFMAMIQLWVALRFRSFVAPLTVGVAGTFFAVAAFGAPETVFVPWVMPVSVIAGDHARHMMAVTLGIGGGILTLLAMMVSLSRREA